MTNFPEPDIALAERLFDTLRARSFDGIGISRDSYGAGEQMAHDLVRAEAEALGLGTQVDFAGNLYMTLLGRDRSLPCAMVGSHLDSVPQGGNFDGAAGVLAGLAVLAGFVRRGVVPGRDITLMAVRAEETPWFPYSFVGSRAALAALPRDLPDTLRRNDTSRTLAEHMRGGGFDPQPIREGRAHLDVGRIACFLELHIEQGPVLVQEDLPVAVVTAIRGSVRWRDAKVLGEYGHSGGVPRAYRRDAAQAFIEFAHRVEQRWIELEAEGHDLVATFCTMGTNPQRATFVRIAGEAMFGLDIRSVSPATLELMHRHVTEIIPEIEARRRVRFDLGAISRTTPVATHPGLRSALLAAARDTGVPHREMGSGGGHDAQVFAEAGVPAGMLFIRNDRNSHNPDEAMEIADFAQACRVLAACLLRPEIGG